MTRILTHLDLTHLSPNNNNSVLYTHLILAESTLPTVLAPNQKFKHKPKKKKKTLNPRKIKIHLALNN